jgi:hypothetical protein
MVGVVELASVSSEVVEELAFLVEAVHRRRDHLEVEVGVVADERGERLPKIVVGATDASAHGAVVAEDEDSRSSRSARFEDRRLEPMRRSLGLLERVRRTVYVRGLEPELLLGALHHLGLPRARAPGR